MQGVQNDTSRRYLRVLLGIVLAGGLAVTAFNLVIDPYGVWRLVDIPGINTAKSERREQNYLFKAADLMRERPQVLLMGSSRVAFGLDPDHPAFAQNGWTRVYNGALTGGHMYAMRRYIEHAIHNNPDLKLIIWGLDFFAFSDKVELPESFSDERLVTDHLPLPDVASVLWSLDALRASYRTVLSNLRRPGYEPYHANGQLTAQDMAATVRRKGMVQRFDQSLRLYLNEPGRLRDYHDSPAAWAELEYVLRLVEQRGIELRLFVSPVHAALLEAIRQRGHWETYRWWLQRLAWYRSYQDFARPGPVTSEPIGDRMTNYWDVSHYRSGVGDRLLECVFPRLAGCNWGVSVEAVQATIARDLAVLDARMAAWETAHPQDVRFVAERLR